MRTKNKLTNPQHKTSLHWEDKAWVDQELDGAYFQDCVWVNDCVRSWD
jgi:hypothetical protein